MARATCSLPVPLSPWSRIVALVSAARRTMLDTACMAALPSEQGLHVEPSAGGVRGPPAAVRVSADTGLSSRLIAVWTALTTEPTSTGLPTKSEAPALSALTTAAGS